MKTDINALIALGSFIVLIVGAWLNLRAFPLGARKTKADALKALSDTVDNLSTRVDAQEKKIEEQQKEINSLKKMVDTSDEIISQRNDRIKELEDINEAYEIRIKNLERQVNEQKTQRDMDRQGYDAVIAEHERTIRQLQDGIKIVKKTTDELKGK